MIIETKEASVESDIDFSDTEYMGVSDDPESLIHLMSLLTNLYNDPELAVIREYYTNALDSHAESGQTRPVDVYLPTRDNPVYVVKDYGIGMSREDISKIYKMYGKSTKRKTNKQRGHFGLGCKSALAIATQFTLTAIKDGKKTTALISKTESGLISVDYLPVRVTDESSGVTVTIPVPDPYTFNEKVKKFFRYSDPTGVLINGEHPSTFRDDTEPLDIGIPGVELYTRRNIGWSYGLNYVVVMGDVGYEISSDQMIDSLGRTGFPDFDLDTVRTSLYVKVGIGDVELTPNREGLRYTDKTKAMVDSVVGAYVETIRTTAKAEIDAVEERHRISEVWEKWSHVLGKRMIWRGEEVPSVITFSTHLPTVRKSAWGDTASHEEHNTLSVFSEYTIVHGGDPKEYKKKVNHYLSAFMRARESRQTHFVFVSDLSEFTSPWVTENKNFTFITTEDLLTEAKAQRKKERDEARGDVKVKTGKVKYPVLDIVSKTITPIPYDEIPNGTPYFDVSNYGYNDFAVACVKYDRTSTRRSSNWHYTRLLEMFEGGVVKSGKVILLGSNRKLDALVKRVDGTYDVATDIEAFITKHYNDIPDRVIDIITVQSYGSMHALLLNLKKSGLDSKIKDRQIRKLINPKRRDRMRHERLQKMNGKFVGTEWYSRTTIPGSSDVVQKIMGRYSLIPVISLEKVNGPVLEHMVSYINAVHDDTLTTAP